jgi:undecaprenyl diphosphate synthase
MRVHQLNDISPAANKPLRHVAIVMDGNGRWAARKNRPRTMGHQAGLKALRVIVEHSARIGIAELTIFAFSSENWNRPKKEVNRLMELFMRALDKEGVELHENGIRIRFIGDRTSFQTDLQDKIHRAQERTHANERMILNVAANYGGHWDIAQAARSLANDVARGALNPADIDEDAMARRISLGESPPPDLLIRTGGEMRISNFLLWQVAYSELWFTPVLWPDFSPEHLDEAISEYHSRERRFGKTSKQVRKKAG